MQPRGGVSHPTGDWPRRGGWQVPAWGPAIPPPPALPHHLDLAAATPSPASLAAGTSRDRAQQRAASGEGPAPDTATSLSPALPAPLAAGRREARPGVAAVAEDGRTRSFREPDSPCPSPRRPARSARPGGPVRNRNWGERLWSAVVRTGEAQSQEPAVVEPSGGTRDLEVSGSQTWLPGPGDPGPPPSTPSAPQALLGGAQELCVTPPPTPGLGSPPLRSSPAGSTVRQAAGQPSHFL